jgi:hypothetical protein
MKVFGHNAKCPRYNDTTLDLLRDIAALDARLRSLNQREAQSLGRALERIFVNQVFDGDIESPLQGEHDWSLSSTDWTEGVRQCLSTHGYEGPVSYGTWETWERDQKLMEGKRHERQADRMP